MPVARMYMTCLGTGTSATNNRIKLVLKTQTALVSEIVQK
jgi:hypothetical protein